MVVVKVFLHSLATVLALSAFSEADAFQAICLYGTPPATIPPPYNTLYCGAEITQYDRGIGDSLYQRTNVYAATGSLKVTGKQETVWVYGNLSSVIEVSHWIRRGPDTPVGQYNITSFWSGLSHGNHYQEDSDDYIAPLGPAP